MPDTTTSVKERARRLCPDRDHHKLIYEKRGNGYLSCGEIENEIRAAEQAAREEGYKQGLEEVKGKKMLEVINAAIERGRKAQREEDARLVEDLPLYQERDQALLMNIAAAIRSQRNRQNLM